MARALSLRGTRPRLTVFMPEPQITVRDASLRGGIDVVVVAQLHAERLPATEREVAYCVANAHVSTGEMLGAAMGGPGSVLRERVESAVLRATSEFMRLLDGLEDPSGWDARCPLTGAWVG